MSTPFKLKGWSPFTRKYKPLTEKEKADLEKKGAETEFQFAKKPDPKHPLEATDLHNINERRIQCEDAGGTWNNGKCIKKKQYVKPEKVGEGKYHYKKN